MGELQQNLFVMDLSKNNRFPYEFQVLRQGRRLVEEEFQKLSQ